MPQSYIHFMSKDALYEKEKPFSLRFDPGEGFPKSNIKMEKHDGLVIKDVRGHEAECDFDENGFVIIKLESQMSLLDFDDDHKVVRVYLQEVADHLRDFFGATNVQVFEHVVRKRHAEFPISTGEAYKYNQPTSMAHIDATPQWTSQVVRNLNGEAAEDLLKDRYQCVNVWKPLKGPLKDWPLALCDASSLHPSQDLEPADLVYADYAVENCQVYFNDAQKWYYLGDQTPSEAWIFRQTDSEPHAGPGVPHSSFPNPLASVDEPPRESIEVRALVFYGNKASG